MSFGQLLDRLARLMRSVRHTTAVGDLQTAQDLIDEENRRDRRGRVPQPGSRGPGRTTEAEKAYLLRVLAALHTLGLEPPTTLDEATRAWKRQLLRVHPDTGGGRGDAEERTASERTRVLNEAYAIVKEHYHG